MLNPSSLNKNYDGLNQWFNRYRACTHLSHSLKEAYIEEHQLQAIFDMTVNSQAGVREIFTWCGFHIQRGAS